jgi:hypothetical protein
MIMNTRQCIVNTPFILCHSFPLFLTNFLYLLPHPFSVLCYVQFTTLFIFCHFFHNQLYFYTLFFTLFLFLNHQQFPLFPPLPSFFFHNIPSFIRSTSIPYPLLYTPPLFSVTFLLNSMRFPAFNLCHLFITCHFPP